MEFSPHEFRDGSLMAAYNAMGVIHCSFPERDTLNVEIKEFDKTLVTLLDKKSEAAADPVLRKRFPGVSILREEGGLSAGDADWIIWIDALDGTSARVLDLPTSTVIIAAYSFAQKRLKGVTIGEPAYMRIWQATEDQPCTLGNFENGPVAKHRPCRTWEGELSLQASVFIDVSHHFLRKTASSEQKQILQSHNLQALFTSLIPLAKIQIPGSNGLTHALVANGGAYAAGAITTAMGGPWDAAGVLLVTQAGGACRAFNIEEDRKLREADPLDPLDYDLLVSGNNQRTTDVLAGLLAKAVAQ